MPKLVVIDLGMGSLYSGLPRITAQVWTIDRSRPEQFVGSLPAAPAIVELDRDWRLLYQSLCDRRPLRSIGGTRTSLDEDLEIDESGITNVSQVSFEQLCQTLQDAFNAWLRSETFLPIERQLRSQCSPTEEVRVVIETDDILLQRLPWSRWDFGQDYPQAEMALSCSKYQCHPVAPRQPRRKARILAVLGNSQGIDLAQDKQFLQQLPDAETRFLVNPSRQEFNHQLWDQQGWDMFFFAGHSQTEIQAGGQPERQPERQTGRIYINDQPQHNSLTIEQFAAAIEGAVSHGLKLAIFNSCDGVGLATALSRLHIPQVIVLREPVANRVAQEFFKYFLDAFAHQRLSLYLAVRQAREQLQGLEDEFPGASWLPVLWQNPAVESPTWQDWCGHQPQIARSHRALPTIVLTSLVATTLVLGIRYLGGLQSWELQAFDQLLRLRPAEPPDQRILIVTITEDDLKLPEQAQRQGSLSDRALAQLLQNLTALKPRAIGLDVYRDFPVNPLSAQLAADLKRQSNFFAICKVNDPEGNFPEIAPLPGLPSDRQGFSDVVIDADSVLRRHLLFMDRTLGGACSTPYALSTQLAFQYLKAEGITPRYTAQGLQLGHQVLPQLFNHSGGYHQVDTAGYQILLNYRLVQSALSPAPTITLKEVLAGRLKPEDGRDRIVLIGVTAPSSKDFLTTPAGQKIPGVFIHAQMVSQLISAVKDGRAAIAVWSGPTELLWVWAWSVVGGVLAWRWRSMVGLLVLEVVGLGTLGVLCFYGLIQSQWVPLVPTAFGFMITSGSVVFKLNRQN